MRRTKDVCEMRDFLLDGKDLYELASHVGMTSCSCMVETLATVGRFHHQVYSFLLVGTASTC